MRETFLRIFPYKTNFPKDLIFSNFKADDIIADEAEIWIEGAENIARAMPNKGNKFVLENRRQSCQIITDDKWQLFSLLLMLWHT